MNNKVCFLCLNVNPGGGNKVIFELSNQIKISKEYDYEIITIQSQKLEDLSYSFSKINDLKTICLGLKGVSTLKLIYNLIITFLHITIYAKRYNTIIINSPLLAPIFGFIPRKNIYNYIQADDYKIFDTKFSNPKSLLLNIYKWATKRISYQIYEDRYIFNSQYIYEQFKLISKRDISKVNLIIPGIDVDIFKTSSINRKSDKIVVSSILRKQPWKGSADFFKAVNELPLELSSRCVFVGITNEDISSLGESNNISIERPNSDQELATLLQKTDIFIVTSHWEGFGLPGLESMACGCTLISTQNGGCNEYAIDEVNCILYQSRNYGQLSAILTKLIPNNTLRKEICMESTKVAKEFSWEVTFLQLKSLLESNHVHY